MSWSPEDLQALHDAQELSITTRRTDEMLRPWVPIWVVVVDDRVYVRTWHRRDTGWFGRAVRQRRARVRVTGLERDVEVEDLEAGPETLQESVDLAYAEKYGRDSASSIADMVTPEAHQTTLQLLPID